MLYGVSRKNPAAAQAFQRSKTYKSVMMDYLAKLHKMTPGDINAKAGDMVKVRFGFMFMFTCFMFMLMFMSYVYVL